MGEIMYAVIISIKLFVSNNQAKILHLSKIFIFYNILFKTTYG